MKIKGLFFSLLLLATVSSYADVKGYQKILGLWDISAPTAPQPYDTGTLNLKGWEKNLQANLLSMDKLLRYQALNIMMGS